MALVCPGISGILYPSCDLGVNGSLKAQIEEFRGASFPGGAGNRVECRVGLDICIRGA